MKAILKFVFAGILLAMLFVTITASLDRNLFDADAYFGFLIFFVWVAYKEQQVWRKVLWFVLIICLGNLAMASYMLIELFKLGEDESFTTLLTQQNG